MLYNKIIFLISYDTTTRSYHFFFFFFFFKNKLNYIVERNK